MQSIYSTKGLPGGASSKEPSCQCRRCKRWGCDPWVGKILWRRKWQPTPVFLPGQFHGQRNLVGYSPWDRKESDTTEWLSTHAHMCSSKVITILEQKQPSQSCGPVGGCVPDSLHIRSHGPFHQGDLATWGVWGVGRTPRDTEVGPGLPRVPLASITGRTSKKQKLFSTHPQVHRPPKW